jgi:hypothetical protein
MSRNFQIEQAKAILANDILQELMPCIESTGKLADQINMLTQNLMPIVDSYSDMPAEKVILLTDFINTLTEFIKHTETNNRLIFDFQQSLAERTSKLIDEYKKAAGV